MHRAIKFPAVLPSAVLLSLTVAFVCRASAVSGSESDGNGPRVAYVVSKEATVRSGPSFKSYVADRLTRGQRVEIHRHLGDWYGIRPTTSCFSWIRADHVTVSDDGTTATIRVRRAKIWIGALKSNDEHRFELEMQRGEEVQVLPVEVRRPSETETATAANRWLKIAPPAGEFRWIHEKLVHIPRSVSLIDNHRAVDPRSNQNASWSGREHGKAGGDSATATPTTLEDAILFLRIEVSQTVAQPIEDWNVGSLLTSAEQLQARARSTWQRGQVARLLDSIEELQALRRKHDLLQEEEEVSNEPRRLDENRLVQIAEPIRLASSNSENAPVAQLGRGEGNGFVTTAGGGAAERSSEDRRESFRAHYDAVGRIMRVHSSRRGTPPFSVLDEQGKLVHLLTPAPGLNVRRLERQRVGITGKITTIEIGGREFSHLMAEQVILLDRKSSGFPFNMAKLPWLLRATER